MRLAFQSDTADPLRWKAALEAVIPDLDFRVWPDIGHPSEVDVLFVLRLPPDIERFTRLKLIQLISAGTDQLAGIATLPAGVPVARLIEPGQVSGMVEYVLHAVLHYHRGFDLYQRQQAERIWREHARIPASDRPVGILGLGALGAPVAKALSELGFDVSGWSRSGRTIAGARTFAGRAELDVFLSCNDIVVGLLPLAPDTIGIFDDAFFSAMRRQTYFINVGRGAQINKPALIRALEGGRLAGATLDVLPDEPPAEHDPIWRVPNLVLTPHVATSPDPRSAAIIVADNLRRVAQGTTPRNAVDAPITT